METHRVGGNPVLKPVEMFVTIDLQTLTDALSLHMPAVLRWCGAAAKRLRHFDVAVTGKTSGSPTSDALTLADLVVQELLVAALRDCDPIFRRCRIEGEEYTGDMEHFAKKSEYTIALDPIDGTKHYRDKTGNGYAVMLNVQTAETVVYSLVYIPETGPNGTWVEACGERIVCGEDDPTRPAVEVLRSIPPVDPATRPNAKEIYLIGFQDEDSQKAQLVTDAGLLGRTVDEMPGSIFELFCRGKFGGSLIHSPNIYDFPVTMHLARILGGDAVWTHNRQPVNFRELWNDERVDMLRLPGIVACSANRETLETLCDVAAGWNADRYTE